MRDYLSKELAHIEPQGKTSGAIKINEKVYQAFLLEKERLDDVVYKSRDQLCEGELEGTLMWEYKIKLHEKLNSG